MNSETASSKIDFTIVTPSYNYGRYIGECLESVAVQEGVTFEHFVMDAGSEDNTGEVVSRYPQVRFLQEPDDGMSDAINKGFAKARGEWVMWLNADDRLKPGALLEVKRFAEEHEDADVVFGCWDFIGEDGQFIRRMTLFPFKRRILVNHGCYIASTSTFFRRSTTIAKGAVLDVKFKAVMDGEYFSRLVSAGCRFEYIPCVLAEFRIHDQSISQKHIGSHDVGGVLKRQRQLAESSAIRRVYGSRLNGMFRDEMSNRIVESVLYHVFRIQKGLLRFLHRRFCREPGS